MSLESICVRQTEADEDAYGNSASFLNVAPITVPFSESCDKIVELDGIFDEHVVDVSKQEEDETPAVNKKNCEEHDDSVATMVDDEAHAVPVDLITTYPVSDKTSSPLAGREERKIVTGSRKVICEGLGCVKTPSYGFESDRRRRSCSQHKQQGMVYLKRRKCSMDDCEKLSSYGRLGGSARFCLAHKSPDMVDLVNRRCEMEGCNRRPVFALPGQKARMCSNHRVLNMMDVVNQRCTWGQCGLLACYGLPGERARCCAAHRSEDMQKKKIRVSASPLLPYLDNRDSSNINLVGLSHCNVDQSSILPNNGGQYLRPSSNNSINGHLWYSPHLHHDLNQSSGERGASKSEHDTSHSILRGYAGSQPRLSSSNGMSVAEQHQNLALLQSQHQLDLYQQHHLKSNFMHNFVMAQQGPHLGQYNSAHLISNVQNSGMFQDHMNRPLNHQYPSTQGAISSTSARANNSTFVNCTDNMCSQGMQNPYNYPSGVTSMYGLPAQSAGSTSGMHSMYIPRPLPMYPPTNPYSLPTTSTTIQQHSLSAKQPSAHMQQHITQEQQQLFQQSRSMQMQKVQSMERYEKLLAQCSKDESTSNVQEASLRNLPATLSMPVSSVPRMVYSNGIKMEPQKIRESRSFVQNSHIQNQHYAESRTSSRAPYTSNVLPSCSKLLGQVNSNGLEEVSDEKYGRMRGNRNGGIAMSASIEPVGNGKAGNPLSSFSQ